MSKRDRHDNDRRGDRRDSYFDDEQQRRPGEPDALEGDSLTALKAILSKVAALLKPLQLTQEESIRLVEQLYGNVLETDVRLAGEADDTRKSSVLAQIQHATVTREGGKIVVQYAAPTDLAQETPDVPAPAQPAHTGPQPADTGAPTPKSERPPTQAETPRAVTPRAVTPAGTESEAAAEKRPTAAKTASTGGRGGAGRSSTRSGGANTSRQAGTTPKDRAENAEPAAPVDPAPVE